MYKYGSILLYMPIYIETLSPVSTQCTMDRATSASYAGSNEDSNKHDSSQIY